MTLLNVMVLGLAAAVGGTDDAQQCANDTVFETLDFWVGEWDVRVGDATVGHNLIEKVLSGCAILEHWTATGGGEGKSLFYYLPAAAEWRQVWVTENPHAPGGVKEKRRIDGPQGAVRFQGEVGLPDGRKYLDRTTLTPLPDGTVRQHIEISPDGGVSWRTTFDAIYVRTAG